MTSATTNTHRKVRCRPRLRVSEREPYLRMGVLLTACSVRVLGECRSLAEGGMTLTCAPVSMRNRVPESRSVIKKQATRGGASDVSRLHVLALSFPE